MASARISKYHILCSASLGRKSHFASLLTPKELGNLATKKDVSVLLHAVDDVLVVRETVIGGGEQQRAVVFV